jgi:LmbE family N-acetylglucosaminyl deacetylase
MIRTLQPENWETPQDIWVILAHPDDPEFFCGASIARWTSTGHHVSYCLLTCGDKGTNDRSLRPEELCAIRNQEQMAAAEVLGVSKVRFLDFPDGYLVPDLVLRRDITRVIRQEKPDVIVTCDPLNLYIRDAYINHPDHRAAGQATLDAVFPSARDHLTFVELWRDEGLEPHNVREVWVSIPLQENTALDVTDFWDIKINALLKHKSQIGKPEDLITRMRQRHTETSTSDDPHYEEKFRRIIFDR